MQTLTTAARWWLWLLLAIFAIVSLGLRQWQIVRRAADRQAWMTRCSQIDTLSKQATDRVRKLFNSHLSRTQLEAALNGGAPYVLSVRDGGTATNWTDPTSGRPFDFEFADDQWVGWSTGGGSLLYPPPPAPSVLENNLERLRGTIAGFNSGYGPLLWIILLIMTLALQHWRPVLAQGMLALAAICTVAWLVNPNYLLTWQGLRSNDMLFWAILMLALSGLAIGWTRQKKIKPLLPLCPRCRYNLTGNVSGICPECGSAIPSELVQRFGLGTAV